MREVVGHKINPAKPEPLTVWATDDPGPGGAHYEYRIILPVNDTEFVPDLTIRFQNGPIAEVGVNGITHEALIAILIDRLKSFQAGPYACVENQAAWNHLAMAQSSLFARTLARGERGVEGTSKI